MPDRVLSYTKRFWTEEPRGIGSFTENGGAACASGAGEIAGPVMEGFIREQGERERFFRIRRDAELRRRKDFDFAQCGGKLRENQRIMRAATGDDELMDFVFGKDEAVQCIGHGKRGENCCRADEVGGFGAMFFAER